MSTTSTMLPRLRSLLLALPLCVATVTLTCDARARDLQIRDAAHVLSAQDVSRLRSVVAPVPFDARFAVTSEYPDAEDLSRYTRSLINEPNVVAVAVDPEHHHVQVHFGVGSHVARGSWSQIERAGNDAFRRGAWEEGAAQIFGEAARAAGSAPDEAVPLAPVAPEQQAARPSLLGPGLLLLIVAGAIAVGIFFARRRSGSGPFGPGASGGYGPGPYPGGGYPPQGGMGPVGGGLIGAGLGGLAGYELGKLEGEREGHDRQPSWDRGGGDPGETREGGFDAGGGGSSWDSGGDGGDGGGGGFDGGGGDSGGGGGSDF